MSSGMSNTGSAGDAFHKGDLQGAVAAGILGCGSVILGASETAGRLFLRVDAMAKEKKLSLEAGATEAVR